MFVQADRLTVNQTDRRTQPKRSIILGHEDGFTKDVTPKKYVRDKCRGLETTRKGQH